MAFTLACSVFYDFAFLKALGLSFSDVPTTIADHVRSGIVWIPPLVVGSAFYVYTALLNVHLDRQLGTDRSTWLPNTATFYKWLGIAAGIVGIILTFVGRAGPSYLFLIAFFGWMLLAWFGAFRRLSRNARLMIETAPLFSILAGGFGFSSGQDSLLASTVKWRLLVKQQISNSATDQRYATGVRRFASVSVVVWADRTVSVLQADSIVEARLLQDSPLVESSLICEWFKYDCVAESASLPAPRKAVVPASAKAGASTPTSSSAPSAPSGQKIASSPAQIASAAIK